MENEIFEMDELAFEPQTARSVGEMNPADSALADRAFGEALVEAGPRILGGGEGVPKQLIGDLLAGVQYSDNVTHRNVAP
ncbi:hypothetical protein [Bradyrhizobium sp. USDA 10063]